MRNFSRVVVYMGSNLVSRNFAILQTPGMTKEDVKDENKVYNALGGYEAGKAWIGMNTRRNEKEHMEDIINSTLRGGDNPGELEFFPKRVKEDLVPMTLAHDPRFRSMIGRVEGGARENEAQFDPILTKLGALSYRRNPSKNLGQDPAGALEDGIKEILRLRHGTPAQRRQAKRLIQSYRPLQNQINSVILTTAKSAKIPSAIPPTRM